MEIYTPNRTCPCIRCRFNFNLAPAVLVTLGLIALLDAWTRINTRETWPLLLIVIGAVKIGQSTASAAGHREPALPPLPAMPPPPPQEATPNASPQGPAQQDSQVQHG